MKLLWPTVEKGRVPKAQRGYAKNSGLQRTRKLPVGCVAEGWLESFGEWGTSIIEKKLSDKR
jgi:hypothetical protein